MILFLLFLSLLNTESLANKNKTLASGQQLSQKTISDVQHLAKTMDVKAIPGFQTDNPPETQLTDLSMADKALSATTQDSTAIYLKEQTQNRQRFTIDPETDPLFKGAQTTTHQEKSPSEEISQNPIMTCEEGSQEYPQSCKKSLVIELDILPEKGHTTPKICDGHWKNKLLGTKWYHKNGCKGGKYVIDQAKSVKIKREEWVDDCHHLETQVDQGICRYVRKTTSQSQETRLIQGESITRPHFEEHYEYACLKKMIDTCSPLQKKGCFQIASTCKEKVGDTCVVWTQTYRCPSSLITRKTSSSPDDSFYCFKGDCVEKSYAPNMELFQVMSHLAVFREAQNDLRKSKMIFKGEGHSCTRNCANFRDCCGNGRGWGVSAHLSSCSKEEKELANLRQQNRCVRVGTYCAEKALGQCIRKKTTFCCYGTKLARLIQENGRRQLGVGWGTPESPQCDGLSAEQMGKINFQDINFSELFQDIQSQLVEKDKMSTLSTVTTERLQENMKQLVK